MMLHATCPTVSPCELHDKEVTVPSDGPGSLFQHDELDTTVCREHCCGLPEHVGTQYRITPNEQKAEYEQ